MTPSVAIALKDLRLLARDKGNFFFTFIFPLLFAIFFGVVFSGGGGGGTMKVAVVDLDSGTVARAFVKDMRADGSFAVLSAESRDAAEAMIRAGKADAAVVLPAGFEDRLADMLRGRSVEIEGLTAPGRGAEAGLLTGKLTQLAFQQMSTLFADPVRLKRPLADARRALADTTSLDPIQKTLAAAVLGNVDALIDRTAAKVAADAAPASGPDAGPDAGPGAGAKPSFQFMPVKVTVTEVTNPNKTPRNAYEVSLTQGVVWGLMGCVTAFAGSLANERARGTMTRLSVAPLRRGQILLGKALGCFVSCVAVQALLLVVTTLAFGVRISNWPMLLAAMMVASVGFTGVMMFMAGLSRTEGGASGMGRAVILILAMIGGGTIPVFFMPPVMQKLSDLSPFKWTTLAFEGALWRGYSVGQMLLPAGILLGVGLVGFVVGVSMMKWSDSTG